MAHSSKCNNELDSNISEMSSYLGRIVLGEEKEQHSDPNCPSSSGTVAHGATNSFSHSLSYIPILPKPINPIHTFQHNYGMSTAPPQFTLTNVTCSLATRMRTPPNNSTARFVNPAPHPRARKFGNYRPEEKQPDTSDIDINATMAELGLTPESLTDNEVYRLFSTYMKLGLYIEGDFIFVKMSEVKSLPKTLNVSVQTKHAIWSSKKILHQMREALNAFALVPSEYQEPFAECRQSLAELHTAISQLEPYKYCSLEHHNGNFIAPEAQEIVKPLIDCLNHVIDCIGKSRMWIQVMESTLNAYQQKVEAAGSTCEGPSQPIPKDDSVDLPASSRPALARRYIG